MRRILFVAGAGLAGLLSMVALVLTWAELSTPSALQIGPRPASSYLIVNIDLLTMEDEVLREDWAVLVRPGNGIIDMGPRGSVEPLAGGEVIDGRGGVLMPGLIDMHVHVYGEADLAANLAYGVTTIRNLGGFPFHLPLASRIDGFELLGPRLISTGPIINQVGSRSVNELQSLVEDAESAREVVRRHHRNGFRDLKVYSHLEADQLAAILDEADRLGMTVSGHPAEGWTEEIPMAVTLDANFTTIEHAESIVYHGLEDDTDPERARALAAEFAAANATVTPTLVVHANLAALTEQGEAHAQRPGMEVFSPLMMGFEAEKYAYWAGFESDNRTVMQAFYTEFTGYLHEAGVRLVVGTDAGVMVTPHGVSVSEEIEWLVRAGLTPHEALEAATVHPAEVLGLGHEIGRIAPGYRSDFLLLDSDPRTDLTALRRPQGVMRDGIWLDQGRLQALYEAASRHDVISSWRRVLVHVVTR
jgi:imidazolonepropionase-like amidohydrolase